MKLAFSQATDDVATLIGGFRQAGYDGLQLKPGQYAPYLDRPEQFLEAHGAAAGAAAGLIAYGPLSDEYVAHLRKVMAFGKAVGSELVVFCHNARREGLTADDIRGFARTLSPLGAEARDLGLKLSLHNHRGQPVMHAEDFEVFFDAVAGGAVGLTLDTAHAALSGIEDIAALIRRMRGVIDNFHMKDLSGESFQVLGRGRIDFAPIFDAVREIGYDGWISADEESGADPVEAMRQCHRFLAAGLGTPG
jgi:sugar phosphate isomerase/epimerase